MPYSSLIQSNSTTTTHDMTGIGALQNNPVILHAGPPPIRSTAPSKITGPTISVFTGKVCMY